jgi:hypothetical protein
MKRIPIPSITAGTSWRARGNLQAASFCPSPVPPMKFVPMKGLETMNDKGLFSLREQLTIVNPERNHDAECDGKLLERDKTPAYFRRSNFGVIKRNNHTERTNT